MNPLDFLAVWLFVGSSERRELEDVKASAASNLVLLVVLVAILSSMGFFGSCGHGRLPDDPSYSQAVPRSWTVPSWPVAPP